MRAAASISLQNPSDRLPQMVLNPRTVKKYDIYTLTTAFFTLGCSPLYVL